MAKFQFSRLAESDLFNIGLYTLDRWGEIQADRYLLQLQRCCHQLADNPGQDCAVTNRGGILISRILHRRMLPENETIDDDDTEPV